MRQEFEEYHAGKQAKKQEKLAYKRQKKHPDHADHWTGQQWSQRTRNAGWVEGWHETASSSSSRWHSQGRAPTRPEAILPSWPLVVQYYAAWKKKKLRPGNMNRSPHQSRDHEPASAGVLPSTPSVTMPGPLNRLVQTTLPITPALGAFIGPKNRILPWLVRRWLRQLALATGTIQPRTAHAQLTGFLLPTPGAFPEEADLLELQWVLLILALRCPLAQFLSWRAEPTSAKVRKYLLRHKYLTSTHSCTLAKFCFLDGIFAANDCALLVTLHYADP